MDRGHCDVIQPDMGRVGGLTEALRCARMAAERGLYSGPARVEDRADSCGHRHFAAAAACCPYAEFFHQDFFPSFLRPSSPSRKWKCTTASGLCPTVRAWAWNSIQTVEAALAAPITVIE